MPFLRRSGPMPLVFTVFWGFFLVAGRTRLLRDPGTFWHTLIGDKIRRDGFFVGDPFTFTHAGRGWIPHQWLGEVIMSYAFSLGGFDAFVVLAAALLAGLFTWLTTRLMNTGLHPAAAMMVAGVALAATANHLHVRPLLMTTICTAVFAAMLTACDAGRIRVRALAWLVPLSLLWANIHGGLLGGLLMMLIVFASWRRRKHLGEPSPLTTWRTVDLFIIIALACSLVAFINPYGTRLPGVWLAILNAPKAGQQVIEENQPLDPTSPAAWVVIAFAAIYLFLLLGVKPATWRVTWLLPMLWFVLALGTVRHAPLFAVTAFVAIAEIWPRTRWAAWLLSHRPDYYDPTPQPPHSRFALLVPAGLVAGSLMLIVLKIEVPLVGANWAFLDRERWPVELIDNLRAERPPPGVRQFRIFNECEFGGFLPFFAPQYRTFVDDRAELFGYEWLGEYVRGSANPAAIRDWQGRYGRFHFALVRPGTGSDDYFGGAGAADGWELVRGSEAAVFYRRR